MASERDFDRIRPAVDGSDRQALAGQRRKRSRGAWRHRQHGVAGGQSLHCLRQQRVGVGAKAKHAPARHQRQRVGLAGRPRQVDRAEIGCRRCGDRRRTLAAQMLPQDGDAVEARRPAAKRRIRQIVGEFGRRHLAALGQCRTGLRGAAETPEIMRAAGLGAGAR